MFLTAIQAKSDGERVFWLLTGKKLCFGVDFADLIKTEFLPWKNSGANMPYQPKGKLEYQKFRVRGHIRTFRDLEIYKQTTNLSSQIYDITLPPNIKNKKLLEEELSILRNISKQAPRLIAEAYGDRFTNRNLAYQKLEKAMQYISNLITKFDFLIATTAHQETKQIFIKLIRDYQRQRTKTLNLKRAWEKIAENRGNYVAEKRRI